MNKFVYTALKAAIVVALTASPFTSVSASGGCNEALRTGANQANRENLQREMKNLEDVYAGHLKQPNWLKNSDGLLSGCANNNWPKPKVSNPFLNMLLSKAAERAVKAACDKARAAISDATSSYQDVLNDVPGFEDIQMPDMPNLGDWAEAGELPLPGGNTGIGWPDLGGLLPGGTIPTIPGITPGTGGTIPTIPGVTPPGSGDPIP